MKLGGRIEINTDAIFEATKSSFNGARSVAGDALNKAGTVGSAVQGKASKWAGITTGIMGAAAGSGVGGWNTASIDGAMIGAAVGAAAVGGATYAIASNVGNILKASGNIASGLAYGTGSALTSKALGSAIGYSGTLATKTGLNIGKDVINAFGELGGLMVKHPTENVVNKATGKTVKKVNKGRLQLSGFGKTASLGIGVGAIASSAYQEYNKTHMGSIDGRMRNATHDVTPYLNMNQNVALGAEGAGATGDLVFAMHKNRMRGYI